MKVVYSLDELPYGFPNPVATIGNFDGVHLGHQSLMGQLVHRGQVLGGTPAIVTFHPHPLQVLAPNNAPRQIQTLPQKLAILQSLKIQLVVVLPFDRKFAQINARDFAVSILWEKLGLKEIYVGPNFAFGHRREGSFSFLKEIGEEKGFVVAKIPQVQFRGSRVSSTAVRQALLTGQVAFARRLLARPYSMDGTIVHGAAKGTGLRVPTANLQSANELVPRRGVYVTYLTFDGKRHRSVTNIGIRPTIADTGNPVLTIETHLLDLDRDLYGAQVRLEFLLRLRDERKFPGPEDLVAQIRKDIGRARRFFGRLEATAPSDLISGTLKGYLCPSAGKTY
jgi:riboflavin kinase / FMN adenylyltransferase